LVEKKVKNNPKDLSESSYENIKFTLDNIFDSKGKKHSLELEFKEKILPGTQVQTREGLDWELDRLSYDGIPLDFDYQTLEFEKPDKGKPRKDSNLIHLELADNQTINLDFGNPWSDQDKAVILQKTDLLAPNSELTITKQDGYEEGKQIDYSFDENGQISYRYNNDQSQLGVYLALAKFTDLEHSLIQTSDNLFRAKTAGGLQIGHANKEGFGSIKSGNLESSNVDSTTEFANIVVLQRMFQACSQIMDIDKQLLEELYKK
jgi:flagellar hook protein FlgE